MVVAISLRRHKVTFRNISPSTRLWLAASVALAMGLVAIPFLRVAEITPSGAAYRAYFSADLMTHLSVVAELQKGTFPPQNPFYAGLTLGYQWLFFLFPAVVGQWIGNQAALLLTNLSMSCLFAALAFAAANRVSGEPARCVRRRCDRPLRSKLRGFGRTRPRRLDRRAAGKLSEHERGRVLSLVFRAHFARRATPFVSLHAAASLLLLPSLGLGVALFSAASRAACGALWQPERFSQAWPAPVSSPR